MDIIAEYIGKIESEKDILKDINSHFTVLQELQNIIKNEFIERVDLKTIKSDYSQLFDVLLRYWVYPVEWDLIVQKNISDLKCDNEELNGRFITKYQLHILSKSDEINYYINTQVSNIKKRLDNVHLIITEKCLFEKLQDLCCNINMDDKPTLQKLINKNFYSGTIGLEQPSKFKEFNKFKVKVEIEKIFNEITQHSYNVNEEGVLSLTAILTTIRQLNEEFKKYIIENFDKGSIHVDYLPYFELMLQNWMSPIIWSIIHKTHVKSSNCSKNKLTIELISEYQPVINSLPEKTSDDINDFISELTCFFKSTIRKESERYLLQSLHKLYLEVNLDDKSAVQELISQSFDVKYVKLEGKYQSVDYFTPSDSDVKEQEVRDEALVSNKNDICIFMGVVLNPYIEQ